MQAAADPVALKSLSLTNFRNYASAAVRFDAPLVVLIGENGAGKTNLLEALSLLSPGRGLRRAPFEEVTRSGSSAGWAISATISRCGGDAQIGTGIVEAGPGDTRARVVRINGATAQSSDQLLDYLRVIWLTPAMDGLFTGPASERRRFLDRLVLTIDAAHARRVRELDRLLTQRNRLLDDNASSAWLDAVEAELAGRAVAVALARAETAALVSARMRNDAVAGSFPAGRLSLTGEFGSVLGGSAAEAELAYRSALRESRGVDRAAGRTLAGPHRTDLDVVLIAKEMPAALSSTGEQKALLIGLVLAHAEIVAETSGMSPLLLLDEVTAHLDPGRRAALFDRLAALDCQVFMTGTDAAFFAGVTETGELLRVANGRVERSVLRPDA